MNLLRRCCLLAAVGVVCQASRAQAQPGEQQCALHVWPGGNARSSYTGWFHGGAVDGDRRGIKGYPAMHAEVLTTPTQQQLLQSLNWSELIDFPRLSVVVHETAAPDQDDRTRTEPLIGDRPGCYEELVIHSVLVERAAMSSTTVRVMVIGKRWRSLGAPPETYSVMRYEIVSLEGSDVTKTEASLKNGFVDAIKRVLTSKFFWMQ